MEIKISYSDRWIVVCIKPVGVLSESGGMPELLKEQLGGEIYPVHRLDRAVGGLMVYAREKTAASRLSAMVSGPEFSKKYLTVAAGAPEKDEGIYRDLLFKDSRANKSYVVKRMRKGVKESELQYKLLEKNYSLSLLRVSLHTGRSHQIRVQFASRGMPLAGDVKYGSTYRSCNIALWSESLGFTHPFTKKPMEFSAHPPMNYPWSEFNYIKEEENV